MILLLFLFGCALLYWVYTKIPKEEHAPVVEPSPLTPKSFNKEEVLVSYEKPHLRQPYLNNLLDYYLKQPPSLETARRSLRHITDTVDPLYLDQPPVTSVFRTLVVPAAPNFPREFKGADIFAPQPTQIPFGWPEKLRFDGCWVVGPRGAGKTNLLLNMIEDDRTKPGCVILMDAKGDIANTYRDKALVIAPSLTHPPALNPLSLASAVHAVQLLKYVFASILDAEMTNHQAVIFNAVFALATALPKPTITDVLEILRDGTKGREQYVPTLNPRIQKLFAHDWNDRVLKERRPEIIGRIHNLLENPYIEAIFNNTDTPIDFGALMDGHNLVLIDNDYDDDVLGEVGSEFLGRLVIAMVRAAATKRNNIPEAQRNPVYFFIDEAHIVIRKDPNVETIINQCRAAKIAMTFAHQGLYQIKNKDVLQALLDCSIRLARPDDEAPDFVSRLRADGVDFFHTLPPYAFGAYVKGVTTKAVAVTVPLKNLPKTYRKPETIPPKPPINDNEPDDGLTDIG